MTSRQIFKVNVTDVHFDPLIYPRKLNAEGIPFYYAAWRYANAIKAGEKMPPIVLSNIGKKKNVLIDGYNRLIAHKQLEKREIDAEYIECKNYDEAFIKSLEYNKRHGTPLDTAEIALAASKLHDKKYSLAEIGSILSLTPKQIEKILLERVEKRNGETIIRKAPFVNKPITNLTNENQKIYKNSTQIAMIKEVVALIENNHIDLGDEHVTSALDELYKLLKRIHTH